MCNNTIKIYVLHYKEGNILNLPPLYEYLMCGNTNKELTPTSNGDDSADNISYKNKYYSELTGIYWAWKNTNSNIIGFCHYRRFFTAKADPQFHTLKRWLYILSGMYRRRTGLIYTSNVKFFKDKFLTSEETQDILKEHDAILPHPRLLKTTVEEHYAHHHDINDLNILKNAIDKIYPTFINAYYEVLQNKYLYANNMFIMKKDDFEMFMKWWFDLLFEIEKNIDLNTKVGYQERALGFIAERLLNIWIVHNSLKIKELPLIYFKKFKKIEERDKDKNKL